MRSNQVEAMVRFIFHKLNALIGFHIMHVIINKDCAVFISYFCSATLACDRLVLGRAVMCV